MSEWRITPEVLDGVWSDERLMVMLDARNRKIQRMKAPAKKAKEKKIQLGQKYLDNPELLKKFQVN